MQSKITILIVVALTVPIVSSFKYDEKEAYEYIGYSFAAYC